MSTTTSNVISTLKLRLPHSHSHKQLIAPMTPPPVKKQMTTISSSLDQSKLALTALPKSRLIRGDRLEVNFVSRWVDYTHKYGLGFEMASGVVGIIFNDSTSLTAGRNSELEYRHRVRDSQG